MTPLVISFGDIRIELSLDDILKMAQAQAPAQASPEAEPEAAAKPEGQQPVQLMLPTMAKPKRSRRSRKISFILQHQIKKLAVGRSIFMPFEDPRKAQWAVSGAAERLRQKLGGTYRVRTKITEQDGQKGLAMTRIA